MIVLYKGNGTDVTSIALLLKKLGYVRLFFNPLHAKRELSIAAAGHGLSPYGFF
jgi:hypothetical protein